MIYKSAKKKIEYDLFFGQLHTLGEWEKGVHGWGLNPLPTPYHP